MIGVTQDTTYTHYRQDTDLGLRCCACVVVRVIVVT